MKFEPKQGDMILVGRFNCVAREFVAMEGRWYLCKGAGGGGYVQWDTAKPLPSKPELTPFTHETWPKQEVWMTATAEQEVMEQVVAIDTQGVQLQSGFVSFSTAAIERLISLDYCQTWQSCHYVPEGG